MKINQENRKNEFIQKAILKHGNNIDFSKVHYINSKIKVCLLCHKLDENGVEHGEYWQAPAETVRGKSCPKCANIKRGKERMTTELYKQREIAVHGSKYGLDKLIYKNANQKICITCPEHGEFWQLPYPHLNGQGCPKCAGRKLATEDVLKKLYDVHQNKYSYPNFVLTKIKDKITIICPTHGTFKQCLQKHLSGQGCPQCNKERFNVNLRATKFIDNAKAIHNNKYTYNVDDYVDNRTKVCITCPTHGDFWQRPLNHLQGCGCPQCNKSYLEIEIKEFLSKQNIKFIEQYRSKWLGLQSLDFYLPNYRVGIECQGEQHFSSIEHFGGEKELEKTIKRDKLKYKKCIDNGIRLLYYSNLGFVYPYNVFEDKEQLLEEIKNGQ